MATLDIRKEVLTSISDIQFNDSSDRIIWNPDYIWFHFGESGIEQGLCTIKDAEHLAAAILKAAELAKQG